MLLSRRAEACLKWVESAECKCGGIAAGSRRGRWSDPYPEVTGYLIPTLINYDRRALAERCGEWLLTMQDADGAFPDRHGNPAIFDTGMVLQGLRALGWTEPAEKAAAWLRARYSGGGTWRCYHALPAALVGLSVDCDALPDERVHYRAYWLEGVELLAGSDFGQVWDGCMQPYRVGSKESPCVVGNIQMAMLTKSRGYLQACGEWQLDSGGFPSRPGGREAISWAAKYFLDAAKEHKRWT